MKLPTITISKDSPPLTVKLTKVKFGWMIHIEFEDGYPGLQLGGCDNNIEWWIKKYKQGKLVDFKGTIKIEGLNTKNMLWMFREDSYGQRIALINFNQAFPGWNKNGERIDVEVKHKPSKDKK